MFNKQKARWMMLGWLDRSKQLVAMAIPLKYWDNKEQRNYEYFSVSQRDRLQRADNLIYGVLNEIRNQK